MQVGLGSVGLGESEEVVHIVLGVAAGGGGVERHGLDVKVLFSRDEWQEVGAIFGVLGVREVPAFVVTQELGCPFGLRMVLFGAARALSIAARRSDFVHVEPEPVERKQIVELIESFLPDAEGLIVHEVHEDVVLVEDRGN